MNFTCWANIPTIIKKGVDNSICELFVGVNNIFGFLRTKYIRISDRKTRCRKLFWYDQANK